MIADVVARLKLKAPSLADVQQAEELAALGQGVTPRHGTCFVMPYREQGEPNEQSMGVFRQLIHVQLLVAFVVRRHDDAKGGAKVSAFDAFKTEIEQALAGWAINPDDALFEFVSARAAPLGNNATAYVQTWQTSRYLET